MWLHWITDHQRENHICSLKGIVSQWPENIARRPTKWLDISEWKFSLIGIEQGAFPMDWLFPNKLKISVSESNRRNCHGKDRFSSLKPRFSIRSSVTPRWFTFLTRSNGAKMWTIWGSLRTALWTTASKNLSITLRNQEGAQSLFAQFPSLPNSSHK